MIVHKLKTWPSFFESMISGEKTFELREDDRFFKVGDQLDLREYDPAEEKYTGRMLLVEVTYILGKNPLVDLGDYIIMSIKKIS